MTNHKLMIKKTVAQCTSLRTSVTLQKHTSCSQSHQNTFIASAYNWLKSEDRIDL